jgi:hypothetical protein
MKVSAHFHGLRLSPPRNSSATVSGPINSTRCGNGGRVSAFCRPMSSSAMSFCRSLRRATSVGPIDTAGSNPVTRSSMTPVTGELERKPRRRTAYPFRFSRARAQSQAGAVSLQGPVQPAGGCRMQPGKFAVDPYFSGRYRSESSVTHR